MNILQKLKRFDAYPKTLEDFRVRTLSGAIVSIVCALIILWLFFSELSYYLSTEIQPELFVDTTRGEKLRINLDVTFPDLPCGYLSIDAMDVAGEHQLDVVDNVFKKRLDSFGNPLGGVEKESLQSYNIKKDDSFQKVKSEELPPDYCGSCYGAEKEPGDCCNTCEEVREAYRRKGWAFAHPDGIEQCIRDGWSEKLEAQKGEGCQVYGHLLVNKVAGNFHFAPGKSFQQQHMHVHDLQPFKMGLFNVSHTITRLSFGKEFPGIINPLDEVTKTLTEGSGMFQYFVKIVPTIYETLEGAVINTNQFSVTEYMKPIEDGGSGGHSHAGLPGVFFMYDLSPIMIKFTEKTRSFSHFLTGVCAIIGGVFTVAGLVDSFIYSSMKSLGKKMELGKAM
eukprot:TRINITY_DN7540_c0_g1_i1.p1 TRINITY_DN7540_c0_g1~~TRINITY_DN7540_c0_g1_i1.p1  ORF type:complete len:393 (+),score=84.11 TRINITY_DN7540_c0_g1_i1:84-1262(+)